LSEEAKQKLGEASAPPIRPITFGAGDKAVKMGEETVLFRHDKKFVNPCAFAVEIKDTLSEDEIVRICQQVLESEMDRVGQKLRIDAIMISNASGDAGKLEAAAKLVAQKIHPMKTTTEVNLKETVERFQEVLRGNPPPWLRKAMTKGAASSFLDD
jgi:acetyl-CoA decarbonylase/synthase complex subunit gamma